MGVAIDVTAQVKANLDLRLQREEMARLSRVALMGELTASLAHELNQPLTAIASNAAAGKRFLAQRFTRCQNVQGIAGGCFDRRAARGRHHSRDPSSCPQG